MSFDEQDELGFDPVNVWDRQLHEPSKAYAAFRVFRDMGPQRTVLGAYRKYKTELEGLPQGNLPQLVGVVRSPVDQTIQSPSMSWRRWAKQWSWETRAKAYDEVTEKEQAAREAEEADRRWKEMCARRETLDELRYQRILKMNELIDASLEIAKRARKADAPPALVKQRMETQNGSTLTVIETDQVKQVEMLCEQERELVAQYFGSSPLPESEEETQTSVLQAAEFRWVPDPEIAASVETSATPPTLPSTSSIAAPLNGKGSPGP